MIISIVSLIEHLPDDFVALTSASLIICIVTIVILYIDKVEKYIMVHIALPIDLLLSLGSNGKLVLSISMQIRTQLAM